MFTLNKDLDFIVKFIERNYNIKMSQLQNIEKLKDKSCKLSIKEIIKDFDNVISKFLNTENSIADGNISVDLIAYRHMIQMKFIFVKNLLLLKKGFSLNDNKWVCNKYKFYLTDEDFQKVFRIMNHVKRIDEKIFFDPIKLDKAIFCFCLTGIETKMDFWWCKSYHGCKLPMSDFYLSNYYFDILDVDTKNLMKNHIEKCEHCKDQIKELKKLEHVYE